MEAIQQEEAPSASLRVHAAALRVRSTQESQFLDITEQVRTELRASGVTDGLLNVQTRHTTTAIVVNENEPLLLRDVADLLERFVPGARPTATTIPPCRSSPWERPSAGTGTPTGGRCSCAPRHP